MAKKAGGAREGAGRKRLYNDPVTVAFIVEREDREKLKVKYSNQELKKYFSEWLGFLLDR